MQPDLQDLAAFATVAKHRSFRKAAVERGVSASAVSHAIRALEERLGVRLLNRTTRSVMPTEAGARLLERLEPAMREIGDALADLQGHQDVPVGPEPGNGLRILEADRGTLIALEAYQRPERVGIGMRERAPPDPDAIGDCEGRTYGKILIPRIADGTGHSRLQEFRTLPRLNTAGECPRRSPPR